MPRITGNEIQFECTKCTNDFFPEQLKKVEPENEEEESLLLCPNCMRNQK